MSRPIVVLVPHFAPDTAPTGEVITRIVDEFIAAGRRIHIVTSLPWYRKHQVESGWSGALWRVESKKKAMPRAANNQNLGDSFGGVYGVSPSP